MKSKTNQNTPNTTKNEPSDENKALAELVRTKVLDFVHDMKKLCKDNDMSFDISGWVEDPVDRGDSPEKTLKFNCAKGDVCQILAHKIIAISLTLQDCIKTFSYNEVSRLCEMSEHLIGHVCKKVMTNLNNKSKTKEN